MGRSSLRNSHRSHPESFGSRRSDAECASHLSLSLRVSGADVGCNNGAFKSTNVDDQPPSYPARIKPPISLGTSQVKADFEQEDVIGSSENDDCDRGSWGNPLEFLMSCIAMSVGLGNVWRFPFTAYQNGGGAFLIPYIIVLTFVGKPLYFMEMAMGQFSGYGSVKVWHLSPILTGVGYSQALANWFVSTYYCALLAITFFYLISSFQTVLPWTVCHPHWINCYDSSVAATNISALNTSTMQSSSALYFTKEVIKKWDNIDDGIGAPDVKLTLYLLLAWVIVCAVLVGGVASAGKVAYFTALFPYVVLVTLLIRGVTLDGAVQGILFFVRPQWSKLLDINTWYAAVTQCFFSLSVGFGPIIMFSSYNPFRHNIYRDAAIISLMDTLTSFLAGVTIFSILGNVAHQSGRDVSDVVDGGPGLAFISYPDAIAKFQAVPQLFAVLFFLMLATLGVGSAVSLTCAVVTVICDQFPTWRRGVVTVAICVINFSVGVVYLTPGGLFVLNVVDYFGAGFIVFVMATIETMGVCWVYGLNRFIDDIEFMLGIRLSVYWKTSWAYLVPVTLISIFCYAILSYQPLTDGSYVYPQQAINAGWALTSLALLQVPLWAAYVVWKQKKGVTWWQRIKNSCVATEQWGPRKASRRLEWKRFRKEKGAERWRWWMPKLPEKRKYDVGQVNDWVINNDDVKTWGKFVSVGDVVP